MYIYNGDTDFIQEHIPLDEGIRRAPPPPTHRPVTKGRDREGVDPSPFGNLVESKGKSAVK